MFHKKVHFIAIGGSVMHALAISLKNKGLEVTGSDDMLFEPSKSKLQKSGISVSLDWNPDAITPNLDAIILGMHAKSDNPELLKAKKLNIPVYSFPEYIYEQSKNQQRIVIAGSHGKTTVTAMVIHVLNKVGKKADYVLGASIDGIENNVKLSNDASVIIIEGDEYFSSKEKPKSKFFDYHHHILVVNGIAWDHKNVFPTEESYIKNFDDLMLLTPKAGTIIYNESDNTVKKLIKNKSELDVTLIPFKTHPYKVKNEELIISDDKKNKIPLKFFGKHNLSNLSAAKQVCMRLRIQENDFYEAIKSFKGASHRLEIFAENKNRNITVIKDFAHSPSKVAASVNAVLEKYNKRKIIACVELHTFSSLQKDFLVEYKNSLDGTENPIIFIDPSITSTKANEKISKEELMSYFNKSDLILIENKDELATKIRSEIEDNTCVLMMSSGSLGGLDLSSLVECFA